MKKRLKIKIFASFMLLVAMLAAAGTVSIIEFRKLSNSVHGLIEDNYKSIEASKKMLEALEREDSGILILMLGEWNGGRKIIESADSMFLSALETAKNNLTETGEEKYIKNIEKSYRNYKSSWQRPIVDTDKQGNILWYKNDVHKLFLETKVAVNSLMNLNQSSMYNEVSVLKDKSQRAIMPGIVSIVSALIFTILLSFFITRYFVHPITELVSAVKNYRQGETILRSDIRSKDEIKELEEAINELITKTIINNQ